MEKKFKDYISKTSLLLIIAGMMMVFSLAGCNSQSSKSSKGPEEICIQNNLLVVERHQVYLDWNFTITADLPISNYLFVETDSQYLSRSVSSIINQELHSLLDGLCMNRSDKEKEDYYRMNMTSPDEPIYDLDEIKSEYQSIIEEYAGGQWISVALIAQTESFVTYGLEHYHCGASCGSKLYCYTFSKKDGRRIKDLITWEDLKRFINDSPKVNHPFAQWQLEAGNGNVNDMLLFDAGLLNDGLLLVNEDQVNHYVVEKVAYEDILPYLSQEAQELVRAMGNDDAYKREKWYIGRCIGELEISEDGKLRLMQREPLWQSFNNLNDTWVELFLDDDDICSLSAYEKRGNIYTPIKIFDQKGGDGACAQLKFALPKAAWEGLSFDDEYFTLDDNILYVPSSKEKNKVDVTPFKYDGHLFKDANSEDTKPQGTIVGKLVSNTKDSICLVQILDKSDPVIEGISAYYVRHNLYIPARIFPYHKTKICKELGDEPFVSSHPDGRGYAFDSNTRKVYEIIMERTSMGGYGCFDRYKVYSFDGEYFSFDKEDGGFWLHPNIRKFGRLFYLGKSKDYLVRIDEMRSYDWRGMDEGENELSKKDTNRYRYTAWKNKDNMLDAPDIIIENGHWDVETNCYVFENDGYIYKIYQDHFEVYLGNKKIQEQNLSVLTCADDN